MTISCLEKLQEGVNIIVQAHVRRRPPFSLYESLQGGDPLHGSLFGIRHLLYLKGRIEALELDVSTSTRSLSFSRLRRGISSLFDSGTSLQDKPGLTGIFFAFIVPEVQENELDAREMLESRLDGLFEDTISWATRPSKSCSFNLQAMSTVILPLVEAASAMAQQKEGDNSWIEGCDTAVSTFWEKLRQCLPSLTSAVGLYLLNADLDDMAAIAPLTQVASSSGEILSADRRSSHLKSNATEAWESSPGDVASMLLEAIKVAVCEGYRQLVSICARRGLVREAWPSPVALDAEIDKTLSQVRALNAVEVD